ncbi:hypothetical protein HDU79_008516 [Rhizoclosmatium sp. JEL0117]|nr:hypothetical protein HDU79_008516 [Rhizoclosmatium sp. JEL0117]
MNKCDLLPVLIIALAHVTSALNASYWPSYPYLGVPSNGARSPCSFLNTLSNHGIIPNSGRGISFRQLYPPFHEAGLDNTTSKLLIMDALSRFGTLGSDGILRFDLTDLNTHASGANRAFAEEHDASLTRNDAFWGDAVTVRPANVNNFLSFSKDGKTMGMYEFAVGLKNARMASAVSNPTFLFNYDLAAAFDSFSHAALVLTVFGGAATNDPRVSTDVLKSFLLEERIPMNWTPSQTAITSALVNYVASNVSITSQSLFPKGI